MDLPPTMRYIAAREPGPPDVLTLAESALPQPRANRLHPCVIFADPLDHPAEARMHQPLQQHECGHQKCEHRDKTSRRP